LDLLRREHVFERRSLAELLTDASRRQESPPETMPASRWRAAWKFYLKRPWLTEPRHRDAVVHGRVDVIDLVRVENISPHAARHPRGVRGRRKRADYRAARESNLPALMVELGPEKRPLATAGELFGDAAPVDVFPLLQRRRETRDPHAAERLERLRAE